MLKLLIGILLCIIVVSGYSPFGSKRFGSNVKTVYEAPVFNVGSQLIGSPKAINNKNVTLTGGIGTNFFETVFQWNVMDYTYPSQQARQQAIQSRAFIPENAAPLGIATAGNRVFVTTPRWNLGVPSSLNYVQLPSFTQSPPMIPYPNWEAHTDTTNPDCSKLLSVYRMAVDECNRLWVIDTGIVNALTNLQQLCPPKIVAFDLASNKQVLSYEFPPDQVKEDSLHTNIVIDIRNGECERAVVYVMDVWRNGLVVFDMNLGTSWRTTNHLYNPDPFASDFSYQTVNFQWQDGIFGGSLSPMNGKPSGDRILYYHPMASFNEFSINTSVLRNQTAWTTRTAPATAFQSIGTRGRRGQSSTSDMTLNGIQFMALVQLEGVGCWDTRKPYNPSNVHIVERDPVKLGFVNDLKLDVEKENVWIVSNNLPIYLYSRLDYNQINFRLLRANAQQLIKNTVCDPRQLAVPAPLNTCS